MSMLDQLCLAAAILAAVATTCISNSTSDGNKSCQDLGYDHTYVRYAGDGRCYKRGERGPCKDNMYVDYRPDVHAFDCVCDERKFKRQVVLWPDDKTCYLLHSKGPCPRGKWLSVVDSKVPTCVSTPCAAHDIENCFFFSHENTCYCADFAPDNSDVDCGSVRRGSSLCPKELLLKFKPPGYFKCSNTTTIAGTGFVSGTGESLLEGIVDTTLTVSCEAGMTYNPFVDDCTL